MKKRHSDGAIRQARALLEAVVWRSAKDGLDALGGQPEDPDAAIRGEALWELDIDRSDMRKELALDPDGRTVLSDDVRDFLIRLLQQSGTGRVTKRKRDELLVAVIEDLCVTDGLKPMRNRSNHGKYEGLSGCGAVAFALAEMGRAIDEATVEKIWEARTKK
jgi:hypothetical protein